MRTLRAHEVEDYISLSQGILRRRDKSNSLFQGPTRQLEINELGWERVDVQMGRGGESWTRRVGRELRRNFSLGPGLSLAHLSRVI